MDYSSRNTSEKNSAESTDLVPLHQVDLQPILDDFVQGEYGLQDLADKYHVSCQALANLAQDEEWLARREEFVGAIHNHSNEQYKLFIARHRPDIARKQLASIEKMHEKLLDAADGINPGNPKAAHQLGELAKAMKNMADIGARLANITEKPFEAEENMRAQSKFLLTGDYRPKKAKEQEPENSKIIDVTPDD